MSSRSAWRVSPGCAAAAVSAAAALLPLEPLMAAVLANSGEQPQEVIVIEGAERTPLNVKPGERITGLCLKGCIVSLVGIEDGDYVLAEGNEIVSVENGLMFYDGAEPPEAGSTEEPPARGASSPPASGSAPRAPIQR
ncbi:MAG: hypothetical protein NW217_03510 [Hyphomicrobiaceae bacterium]|nr:hypothetical protein [Hyphomicrobiaceae bacterium]